MTPTEAKPAFLLHRSKVPQVPGIRHLVYYGHKCPLIGQPLKHEIGTDETGTAVIKMGEFNGNLSRKPMVVFI